MTREEIEKEIADAEAKLATLREELDKLPKRETVRRERWCNHYIGAVGAIYQSWFDANEWRGPDRLGPAERIVREFDLVDGCCVEQRCGLTGRVIWREGGVDRVEKPEPLMTDDGRVAARCDESGSMRFIYCEVRGMDFVAPADATPWLRRAVAWVNDGEVGR